MVVIVGLLAALVVQDLASERASAIRRLLNLAEATAGSVAEVVGTSQRAARAFASDAAVALDDPSKCDAWLGRALDALPLFTNLLLVDDGGTPVCSHHPNVVGLLDYGDRQWVQDVMQGRPVISDPLVGKLTGAWAVVVAAPVLRDGQPVGAAVLGLELARFQEILSGISLPERALITLATNSGTVLGRSLDPERWVGSSLPPPTDTEQPLGTAGGLIEGPSMEGEPMLFANVPVSGAPWRVYAGWSEAEALGGAWRQARQSGAFALLLLVLTAAGLAWVYVPTTRSLGRLVAEAGEAARSGLPLSAEGPVEIRSVAGRINETLATLGRAEDQARKLARVASQLADPVFITDRDGVIEYVNPAFERVTGYSSEEALGQTPAILNSREHPEDVYADLWRAVLSGETYRGRIRNRRKNGRTYTDEKTISPLRNEAGEITHFVATGRDVTDQEAIALRLRRAEKLEAVGQLAGGVAHDFNNVLTAITGYAELLSADLKARGNEEGLAHVREILEGAQMAGSLTHQLLTFSRREVVEADSVALNAVIKRVTSFLRRVIPADIGVAQEMDPGTPPVWIDPIHAEQIVLNLALNARDAMPDGGVLTLRTSVNGMEGDPEHGWAVLEVGDTGTGMPTDMTDQIFDPFFTTKGHGTGLGLATVREVVSGAGGTIRVDTVLEEGTTFRVTLPPHSQPSAAAKPHPAGASTTRSARTILLAEDDAPVRTLLTRILERAGHDVVAASDGRKALEAARTLDRPVDLVVTDVMMPEMKGPDLVRELRVTRPGMPALFITGHAGVSLEESLATGHSELLPKPVSPAALRDAVDRLAGRGTAPTEQSRD
jgi:PAS domain S-box-containing protein